MGDPVEQELHEDEPVLRALLDGASDAIYLKNRAGRYVFANAAWARIVDLPAEAVVGKDDFELFRPEEADLMRATDQDVARTGEPRTFEETLTRALWTRVYHTTKTPYRCRSGQLIGIIGVSRDVTVDKAQELASARLAAIVDSSADAVIGVTRDGTMTSWNAAAERMFGYSRQEALGSPVRMLVPPERRRDLAVFHDRLLRGEEIENHETLGIRKDGTRIAIELTLSPIRDPGGAVVGTSMIARDITERRRIEKELLESEKWQRLAVEAANLGLWHWDIKDNRLVWTLRCRSMHGIGPDEEVTYERFLALLHPADRENTEEAVRRALGGCSDYHVEHRVRWPDGSVHWISTSGCVVCNDAGIPDRMLGVAADITAQKSADEERAELLRREQAARAEAQAATRAKDEFLAVLSHELRTPLQSILGWTRMLKAPDADPRLLPRGLETIERNVEQQTRLIEDLLDVSRIVTGKLHLMLQRVDLALVIASALASTKAAIDAKSIDVQVALEPPTVQVFGDPGRLEQIVLNLLSNAVKFTPAQGNILVRLERESEAARLVVADTGAGISEEFLPHVFERFRQAESTAKRSPGGLGLGLAIVHHLVGLHGGTVSAESAGTGRGARFTVTLPIAADERRS